MNGKGYSVYSNTLDVTTRDTIPVNPYGLRVANTGASTVDLNWDDRSDNETGFEVVMSDDGSVTERTVGTVAAGKTSFRVEGLKPGGTYLFVVRAVNAAGVSAWSNTVGATTPNVLPVNPYGLRVANVWARTIDLNWDDRSDNETGFEVVMSDDGSVTERTVGTVAAGKTSFRVEGLKPGGTYLFVVRAVNAAGVSAWSNTVGATTPNVLPVNPYGLRVANVWARTIDLNWDDRSDNETGFEVVMSDDGSVTERTVGTVAAGKTSFRVEGLKPGGTYLFVVRAVNAAGVSAWSNTVGATTPNVLPVNPYGLRVANVWARTIDLNWDDRSDNETGFEVVMSDDGSVTERTVGTVAAGKTSFRVEGLKPGGTYLFVVRAVNAAGVSAWSNTVGATTPNVPPAAPMNLRAGNVWARAIDLNWDDRSDNETEYRVAISRDGGATWDNIAVLGANTTSFRVEGLKANTRYLFRVRAANAEGFSDYSNTLDMKTRS